MSARRIARRVGTVLRLTRWDRRGLVTAVVGRVERMVVFATSAPASIGMDEPSFRFRKLTADDLRTVPMPGTFRDEQLVRLSRLGVSTAYGVFLDGELAHISWFYDRELEGRCPPRYLDLLPDEGEISACFTLPGFRGQGTYGIAIRGICAVVARAGIRRVYMKTAPTNRASRSGIERAGLQQCGDVIRIIPPLAPSSAGWFVRRFPRRP
jgi:hypothetical protein